MNSDQNSRVCCMSVDSIFSSEMYHNDQWCMIHSGNVMWTTFFEKLSCQWKNGSRKLLTAEKEEASSFQAADLAATVGDMLAELYCQQKQSLFQKLW